MIAAIVKNQRSFVCNNGATILRHKNSKRRRSENLKAKTADIRTHISGSLKLSLHFVFVCFLKKKKKRIAYDCRLYFQRFTVRIQKP